MSDVTASGAVKSGVPGKKICPECGSLVGNATRNCECGHVFNVADRSVKRAEKLRMSLRIAKLDPDTLRVLVANLDLIDEIGAKDFRALAGEVLAAVE